MKASHYIGKNIESFNANDSASLCLSNRKGGFLYVGSKPVSKYNGWFVGGKAGILRVIEDIFPVNAPKISELSNRLFSVERERQGLTESFFIPKETESLVYTLNQPYLFGVTFDIRRAYDFRVWGRNYKVTYGKNSILVEFSKSTHGNEDKTNGEHEFKLFVAVRHDGISSSVEKWINRKYLFDEKRKSSPYERHVYDAFRVLASTIVFSASDDKQKAIDEANSVFMSQKKLLETQESYCSRFKSSNAAFACASKSLDDLYAAEGLYAGLPWFFQFWARDEAISSKAFAMVDSSSAKKILFSRLDSIMADGRIPNIAGIGYSSAPSGCADGIGWLSVRFRDLMSMKLLSAAEKKLVADKLEQAAANIRKHYEREGLIYNGPLETWMDTSVSNDTREGFRIEIQALQLALYDLLYILTKKQEYMVLQEKLSAKVKELFWNGKILADGLNDFTPRPNVFIAAYAYPKLLANAEWSLCFDNLLHSLWLEWGGLATIDKHNPLFRAEYSGEPPISYHRGDSWFWINNLAAIVMHRTDPKAFRFYIEKIYEASTNDILWNGAIGCHSELSSALEQRAEGSQNQAWSNAMYVELCTELKKE